MLVDGVDMSRARTYAFSGGQQRPTLAGTVLGTDPVVLAGTPSRVPQPLLFSYAPSSDGLSVVVDGKTKAALPGGLAVAPGRHRLALVDPEGTALWSGEVELEPGQRSDVSELIPPPVRWSVMLDAYSLVPLEARTRDRLLPPSFGGGVRARVQDVLPRVVLELGLAGAGGAGPLSPGSGFSQSHALFEVKAGAAYRLGWGGFDILPSLGAGVIWVWRDVDLVGVELDERLRGATFHAGLGLERTLADHVLFGLRAEVGAIVGNIGSQRVHPTAGASLWVGYRL